MTADQELAFLRTTLGVTGGTLNDLRMQYYGGTGTQQERASAFWKAGGGSGLGLEALERTYLKLKTGRGEPVTLADLRQAWFSNPAPPAPPVPDPITLTDAFPGANGAAPNAWWTKAASYPTTGTATIQSGGMVISTNSTTPWTPAASVFFGNPNAPQSSPEITADSDQTFGYQLLNLSQHYPMIGIRARNAEQWSSGDGSNSFKTGYMIVIAPMEQTIDVVQGYSSLSILPNAVPVTIVANMKIRILIDGRRLAFKFWPAANAEPTAWTYDNPNLLFDESDGSIAFSVANGPSAEAKTVKITAFSRTVQPASLGTAVAAPTAGVANFTPYFTENFDTAAAAGGAAGQFAAVYANSWTNYSAGGTMSPLTQISAHDGVMDIAMDGAHGAAGWWGPPATSANRIGGRFSMRAKAVDAMNNGPAVMIWPSSDVWSQGEIDFPESVSGPGGLQGFQDAPMIHHHSMTPGSEANAQDVALGVSWRDWHVYTCEWYPPTKAPAPNTATGLVIYYVDGVEVYRTTTDIPSTAHRYTVQVGDYGMPGHLYIDWIRIDALS